MEFPKLFSSALNLPGCPIISENPQPFFCAPQRDNFIEHDATLTPEEAEGLGKYGARRLLPYRMQERYVRSTNACSLKTLVLENEHLRATFLPTHGGKLWSLFSKDENRELLFQNPVFQPANLANRNAWTAGGIEWNVGHLGHHSLTASDVFCASVNAPDSERFLRIYWYEATHAQLLQMDFHLPSGAKQLGVHVRIANARGTNAPLYWWTNIAVPLSEETRVFSATPDIIYQTNPGARTGKPGFGRCQMPEQPNLPDIDLSFPTRIPRSVEYFFQNSRTLSAPWETATEGDGTGFFERSTQPLYTRKMFCWGMGAGGRHWCDYLSAPGKGSYIEIQAGLAPTQNHVSVLPAGGTVSFTQLFGAFCAPSAAQSLAWNDALPAVADAVEQTLSADAVCARHAAWAKLAELPCDALLHTGDGWGALELARRAKAGEAPLCAHLSFPLPQDSPYAAWLVLLDGGVLPDAPAPLPYLTDPLWLPLLEASLAQPGGRSAQSLFQYAVSLAENGREAEARETLHNLWRELHSPWAAHALGTLAQRAENILEAAEWFCRACEAHTPDPSFCEDAIAALTACKRYDEAWALYEGMPEKMEKATLLVARAALELDQREFLEAAFAHDFASIREGEAGLADLWLEYRARRTAEAEGVPFSAALIDPALPLPRHLNFRMWEDEAWKQAMQAIGK